MALGHGSHLLAPRAGCSKRPSRGKLAVAPAWVKLFRKILSGFEMTSLGTNHTYTLKWQQFDSSITIPASQIHFAPSFGHITGTN